MANGASLYSASLMERLAKTIEAETGLLFPEAKWRDLKAAIHRIALATGLEQDAQCIDWLLSRPWGRSKADLCASHLTIGETYFFREPRAFDLVCDYAREKMANSTDAPGRLRIWSAGCCTGEEPYSIAMALKTAMPELDPRTVSILGTDISGDHLQFARAGVYRSRSFRSALAAPKNAYFSEENEGQFRLNGQIKELVKFSALNLAAPVYPSPATDTTAIDIIFCRNVLMYFSKQQALKVIERFRRCLVNGGWLIVSPSEASSELFAGFSGVYHPDAIFYQKSNAFDHLHHSESVFSGAGLVAEKFQTVPAAHGSAPAAEPREAIPAVASRPQFDKAGVRQADALIKGGNIPGHDTGIDAALQAHALANEGKAKQAMQHLERAIQDAPARAELYHAKALIAMECGDTGDAIRNFKRVVYLKPDFILAHYLMGILQSAENRHHKAIRQFETVSGLLATLKDDEIVPGSEGLSVAYLQESVRRLLHKESV